MYATIKELKRKAFRVKNRNIKEAIGVQVTFISENKHQKAHFAQNKTIFVSKLYDHFQPLLGWESANVCIPQPES